MYTLKKTELEKLEQYDSAEGEVIVDEIYVVSSDNKHPSDFQFLEIYGVQYQHLHEVVYARKLTDCADNILFRISPDVIEYLATRGLTYSIGLFNVDYPEPGVSHYYGSYRFKIENVGSDVVIALVKGDVE